MSQLNDAPGGSAGPDRDSLDRLASRFEAAWEKGPPPTLDDFVPPNDLRALTELVHIDLERRLKAGEGVRVEGYLERYPALAEDPEAVLALIRTEYEQRCRGEPDLSVAEYRQRLPQYSAALDQRLGESTSPPGPGLAKGSTRHSAADGSGGTALSPEAGAGSGPRYRALHFHARGGLGEVWVAHDEEFQREVALKRIREDHADDAESRRRFLREAEVTGRLEHPGIVPAYGLTHDADGRPCYAMRLVRGGTLKDAIQRFHQADIPGRDPGERSLALRQLLGRFIAVCQAVAYAHGRGIVHRDLKPSNVMLGEKYGETLVVDWGLAKVVGRREADRVSAAEGTLRPRSSGEDTRTGQTMGTLAYMSPEQAAGRWDVLGPASDVYSLGATLYHILTSRAPFGDGLPGEVVLQVQRGEFPRPRQVKAVVPRALEAICLKAMGLRAEQRYATALELAADVEHWLADEPVAAYREPWSVRAGRWVRRHKTLVSASAAAVLVAVLGGSAGIIWYQDDQNRRATEAALRAAAEDRKFALAQQGVAKALKQAEDTRHELHKMLGKPGGVFDLLNDPARWQALIQAARGSLQRAAALLANAGPKARAELARRLRRLEVVLSRDDADRTLALRLEKIRLDSAAMVEGEFDHAQAEREYPRAFQGAGLGQPGDPVPAVAERLRASAVKARLVAALDHWAWLTTDRQRRTWLLALARQADPDPTRNRLRDPRQWQDRAALERLARQAQAAQWSPQLLTRLAIVLTKAGEDARPLLKAAQRRYPQDFWLNFELGNALYEKKQLGEAVGYYRAALALRPNSSAVHNNLGVALHARGDLDGAIACYETALALDPKHAQAQNNLGVALHARGDLDGVIACCQKALALNPKNAQARNNLCLALKAKGDLDGAIACCRKGLALDPKHAMAYNNLGLALAAKGDRDGAIACYETALALDPKAALAHYNLGNALYEKGELDRAIACYRKGLALDPKYAKAHNNLGLALADKGQLDGAIACYRKALALDPKLPPAHVNLGNALAEKGDRDGAIACYRKALDFDPKNARAHTNLGAALEKKGEVDRAIACYQKALALDPNFAPAHIALGLALLKQGRLREARDRIRHCLQLPPQRHPLHSSMPQLLRLCERLLILDARLPTLLKGKAQPASPAEGLEFAALCRLKKLSAAAARFSAEAFAADPKLADNLAAYNLHAAARAAALAAAGQGRDAGQLTVPERARLRQQALTWLRADLARWTKILDSGHPQARAAVQRELRYWQGEPDLAGIRDAAEVAWLPETERIACRQLWADVDALLKRAGSPQ
jgi:serine/threonine-protein kinase